MAAAEYCVIDVETTGFSPKSARILEIGIVLVDQSGGIAGQWTQRLNPQGPVGATHVHGIRPEDVVDAPLFADVVEDLIGYLRGRVLVAHNARFDCSFLKAEFTRAGWDYPEPPSLCTMEASKHYLPDLPRRRLSECCAAIGYDVESHHSALSDALAAAALLRSYVDPQIPPEPRPDDIEILYIAKDVVWPIAPNGKPRGAVADEATERPRPAPKESTPREIEFSGNLLRALQQSGIGSIYQDRDRPGHGAYIERVVEALADGILTVDEGVSIAEVSREFGLSDDERHQVHVELLLWLGMEAYSDTRISQVERLEMTVVAELLDLPDGTVSAALSHVREYSKEFLSEACEPLPEEWTLGEPLRVGDRICFTAPNGDLSLVPLEDAARSRGVLVGSSVTAKTAMLVTDGKFHGRKAQAADALGTRIVSPEDFAILLEHIQPAESAESAIDRSPGEALDGSSDASPALIRAWARDQGIEVPSRGRLPRSVIEAYDAAHS